MRLGETGRCVRRLLFPATVCASILAGGLPSASGQPFPMGPAYGSVQALDASWTEGDAIPKLDKLDFALSELLWRYERSYADGTSFAQRRGVHLAEERVRVVAEATGGRFQGWLEDLEGLGASIEVSSGGRAQLQASLSSLPSISQLPAIRWIRLPETPQVSLVTSEGAGRIGAESWRSTGITGRGVKIAVLDVGFKGYKKLLGNELPAEVVVKSFRSDENIEGAQGSAEHGTAVAEIVADVAPNARLYLVNSSTEVEMGAAVDWLIQQRVDIISASIGFYVAGPGDGTGYVADMVARARRAGILWVNAAGNEGDSHWSGLYSDPDGDGWHNFSGSDEGNTITLEQGQYLQVALRWNDWLSRNQDFDLYLFRGGSTQSVASSRNTQNGGLDPVEVIQYQAAGAGEYHIAIYRHRAERDVDFDLFVRVGGRVEPCSASATMVGRAKEDDTLAKLRAFRDGVLLRNAAGNELVRLFNRHTGEVARLLLADAELRDQFAQVLETLAPALDSWDSLGWEGGLLTGEDAVRWHAAKEALLLRSSPQLREDILRAWQDFDLDRAEGKTLRGIWDSAQGRRQATLDRGASSQQVLQYLVPDRSLAIPGDSPNALTVAATRWNDDGLEAYSSRGPTLDGRMKPDISAPTRVSTATYGRQNFAGTSSSTPHVSGVAALVKSAYPSWGPEELQAFLERNALDLGPQAKDTMYGSGRLSLPQPEAPPAPTPAATPTYGPPPTATITPTPTSTRTASPTPTPTPTRTFTPTATPPGTFEVSPYGARYRYQVLLDTQSPPPGFERPTFDDSNWSAADAAFGSGGACSLQATVRTRWPANTRLLVRRGVSIPAGVAAVRIMASVDDNVVAVYLNGTQISGSVTYNGCPSRDDFRFDVPLSSVRPGWNVLAFHLRDRGGQSFFDARILAQLPTTATPSPTGGPLPGSATPTATIAPSLPYTPTPTPVAPPPPPPVGGRQVTYSAGWNLVAGPAGTTFPGAANILYTFQEGASYTLQPNIQGVTEGWGYWAYFAAETTVTFSGAGSSFYTTTLGPGQTKMVGNPSGTKDAVATAEKIYTYSAKTGYTISFGSATLPVGTGAWVYSTSGGAVTVTAQ